MAQTLLPQKGLIALIKLYRYCLSPFIGQACRFFPSCSCYAEQAIVKHGCFKGIWLGLKRILRCHPFAAGGEDPVP